MGYTSAPEAGFVVCGIRVCGGVIGCQAHLPGAIELAALCANRRGRGEAIKRA